MRSVPLGERRGAGRPKGTGKKKIHCLTKSPPRRVMAANHDASSMSLGQEEQEVVAPRVVVVPRLAVPLVEEVPQEEVVPRRRCQQARPPPSSAPPSSSAPPPSTPAPGSLKRKASEVAVGRRTRARGQ